MSDVAIKSYTQELVDRFVENGMQRLKGLSENDLASVIYWLETKAMELRMVVAIEDDPLQSAKYRGAIEHFGMATTDLMETLKSRLADKEEAEGDGD